MEAQVRSWAIDYDSIYVVTGPVLMDGLSTIGSNSVSIPGNYYKCALRFTNDRWESIGFVIKNEGSKLPLPSFAVSIDSVESITGLDLYPFLRDSVENRIESEVCVDCWNWKIYTKKRSGSSTETEMKQCIGLTKANKRCKITTSNINAYCHVHEFQTSKERLTESLSCEGITQMGRQCKRMTYSPTLRCSQHDSC